MRVWSTLHIYSREGGYINSCEATDTVYAQTRTPLGTHRHTDSCSAPQLRGRVTCMSYNPRVHGTPGLLLSISGLSSTVSIRRTIGGVNRCIVCGSVVCRVVGGLTRRPQNQTRGQHIRPHHKWYGALCPRRVVGCVILSASS